MTRAVSIPVADSVFADRGDVVERFRSAGGRRPEAGGPPVNHGVDNGVDNGIDSGVFAFDLELRRTERVCEPGSA